MTESKKPNPRWWIPYWIIQIVLAIAFWIAGYLFLNFPLHVASTGLAITLVFVGALYYIRLRQPTWLKPYWIAIAVSVVAFGAASYFLMDVPLERATASTIFILLATGFGYYMRVRPNIKTNRAMYIGLGAVLLGFVFWIVLMASLSRGIRWFTGQNLPDGIFALVMLILCYIAGGIIGDWIGKRREYRLPMYP